MPPPTTTTTLDPVAVMTAECPTSVCLVYHISPEARWSDGSPVVAADFVATVAAHQSPLAAEPGPGYDLVSRVDTLDDRVVRVALREEYGAWQELFSRLIPAHAETLDISRMPSTGAFTVEEWGDRIVVLRNDEWWSESDPISGSPLGSVTRIEFVFIPDPEEMVEALTDGSVDVIAARPDEEMVSTITETAGLQLALSPGPFWEHIDFNHGDAMLAQPWVREMFDLAIDRQKILDRSVRLLDPATAGLDNTVWMSNAYVYEPHYQDRFDPAAAEQMLVDHGCSLEGGIYSCAGREMSFVWASTSDDPDRREILASVAEDLETIGVELVPDLRTPSVFVTRDFLFGGPDAWQLINFSWRAESDPQTTDATYSCDDSVLNVNRFCSPEVEAAMRAASREMEPGSRAALYNEADRLYLQQAAIIPLYQKPGLMAWSEGLAGPVPNFTRSSDLWNVAAWTGPETLVVALPSEPASLDVLGTRDESANIVLSTLFYGAYGMSPSFEHIPVLVDSVEVVRG
jgi:peptide/nickel transport system substrate-binding protein